MNSTCGVTYRLLAGRHRPDEAVEDVMWGWPQIEVSPDHLDYSRVHLRQPLDRHLECETSGNVLPQKGDNFPFFLAQILRVRASSGHDSREESDQNHKGSRDQPLGGEGCWVITSKIAQN